MIDKRAIIKEHLKDCDPGQLHDNSYVTIKECIAMMEVLEQKLVKNLGLHIVSNCRCNEPVKCMNCDQMVVMVSTGEICPSCYC